MTLYVTTPFERTAHRMMRRMLENGWPVVESSNSIPVTVKVEDDSYVITALVPGMKAEDLNIQVVNETVTLEGKFEVARDEKDNFLVDELTSGSFIRTLTLPDPLDANHAEAKLENGVLTLHVPKAEEARPKSIKVISK